MAQQLKCPECEKLSKISEESQKIKNFIEWLRENGMEICTDDVDGYYPAYNGATEQLLAKYFEIDLNKVEDERREFLKWMREQI